MNPHSSIYQPTDSLTQITHSSIAILEVVEELKHTANYSVTHIVPKIKFWDNFHLGEYFKRI